jgi:DNA-binding NarL/FixJ family response regulator
VHQQTDVSVVATEPERSVTAHRVLVVEDEALIRLDLIEMLSEEGYVVVGEAADGQQAVEQAAALRPAPATAQLRGRCAAARLASLTQREREVMQLVADGASNKRIADQLHLSVRTVEVHRARVFEKMEVRSAVELANALRGHAL